MFPSFSGQAWFSWKVLGECVGSIPQAMVLWLVMGSKLQAGFKTTAIR
jgi:hypothetical protein